MTRIPFVRRRRQAGFTLVELMVALGLSMILAIVLLKMQAALGQQRMRTSDIAERDGEIRAAMDFMTQDMSSSAFLFGNATVPCDAIVTYNGASGAKFFAHHEIDAVPSTNGAVMNFATGLTMNYPTDTTPSDVLVMTTTADASRFNDPIAPQISGDPSSSSNPIGTGIMKLSVGAKTPPVADGTHMAIVQAPIVNAANVTQSACLRVPISSGSPTTGLYTSALGNYMPAGFYTGFQTALTAAGFGTLGNGQLYQGSKFIDIGATTAPTQTTTAYYIDNNAGSFPVLMRAQYSLLDDTIVPGTTPQRIAAGVVSLQARFNVGGGTYQTAATTTANGQWGQVCSVRVAIITRSINDDPDPNYSWAPTAITPGTATSIVPGAPFSNVAVPSAMSHRRYLLQTTELAVRNAIWGKQGGMSC